MPIRCRQTAHQILAQAQSAQAGDRGAQWSVPWSDLMLTMFVLFLGLYAYSVGPVSESRQGPLVAVFGAAGPEEVRGRRLAGLYEQMRQRLDPVLGPGNVSYSPREGIRIYLPQKGFFGKTEGSLLSEALPALQEIADLLHMVRSPIVIAGYVSEAQPGALGPFELAVLRAARVATYLSSSGGIDPAMLSVQGFGLAYPRVPVVSPEFAKRNQRVEIRIAPEAA